MQLGHQAVNCTNGTINWKQIYGDEAFRLKKPIYESDYQALKKSKQVDLVDLEKRARQYAKVGALCSHVTSVACLHECLGGCQVSTCTGSSHITVAEGHILATADACCMCRCERSPWALTTLA